MQSPFVKEILVEHRVHHVLDVVTMNREQNRQGSASLRRDRHRRSFLTDTQHRVEAWETLEGGEELLPLSGQ